ncbi:MAG: ABC transporter ATP-binding protein [Candidatus Bathyarchaeota archaeon]|nr:ABC transporter ATP-binding protein [Candidatus Bathyarchaeota archaeon]
MIQTQNLTRKFGDLTAVDNLTLRVREGEVFGFLGPNAAGKTTTVRMLCCLISKTSGSAHIGEYDVDRNEDCLAIRKLVGFLPENVGLYDSLSAYKNLDFYGKLYEVPEQKRQENIERLLRLLGIWERKDDNVGSFSKGTKQKIAIARALIHDPQLLFLDEPTANLDPEASKTVRDFVLELKKEKRTIFINTHNLDEAERLCDRIAILKTRLVTVGSPQELKRSLYNRKTIVHFQQQVTSQIEAAAKTLSFVKSTRIMENKLILDMDNPERDNPELIRAIVATGANIQYVTELKSTLEDVYLKVIREATVQ